MPNRNVLPVVSCLTVKWPGYSGTGMRAGHGRAGRIARRGSVRCLRSCAPFSLGVAGALAIEEEAGLVEDATVQAPGAWAGVRARTEASASTRTSLEGAHFYALQFGRL